MPRKSVRKKRRKTLRKKGGAPGQQGPHGPKPGPTSESVARYKKTHPERFDGWKTSLKTKGFALVVEEGEDLFHYGDSAVPWKKDIIERLDKILAELKKSSSPTPPEVPKFPPGVEEALKPSSSKGQLKKKKKKKKSK